MDAFVSRKKRRIEQPSTRKEELPNPTDQDDESTDFKLALLASLHPDLGEEILLEALLANEGCVEEASKSLTHNASTPSPRKKHPPARNGTGHQTSLRTFSIGSNTNPSIKKRPLTQKGRTLHLYDPADIELHTPCSIIHNFLPPDQADALLKELLAEAPTFSRDSFKLFDRVVSSPHSFCFYVDGWDEVRRQKEEYVYNGGKVKDVRPSLPCMLKASTLVQRAVNTAIHHRITTHYPNAQKLLYQSPHPWTPNTAFVNCYTGPTESVGFHTDELTYLGPRAIIGSLSLGVAREFRIRKIVASDSSSTTTEKDKDEKADEQGQISITLPHNSLLVMHAEMQEEWKHAIAPAKRITPHPLAGNRRINITYRCYRESLHPRFTPKCRCGVSCVLRCVMRKVENRGRYVWMCHTGYQVGNEGCGYFEWAVFDADGVPVWGMGAGRVEDKDEGDVGGEGVDRGKKEDGGHGNDENNKSVEQGDSAGDETGGVLLDCGSDQGKGT